MELSNETNFSSNETFSLFVIIRKYGKLWKRSRVVDEHKQ